MGYGIFPHPNTKNEYLLHANPTKSMLYYLFRGPSHGTWTGIGVEILQFGCAGRNKETCAWVMPRAWLWKTERVKWDHNTSKDALMCVLELCKFLEKLRVHVLRYHQYHAAPAVTKRDLFAAGRPPNLGTPIFWNFGPRKFFGNLVG